MKQTLLIIIAVFISIVFLILVGNIITIGEKLSDISGTNAIEYCWYGIMGFLFAWFIFFPCLKIFYSPTIPSLSLEETKDIKELHTFAKQLASNCMYIPDPEIRRDHAEYLRTRINIANGEKELLCSIIQMEINSRVDGNEKLNVISMDRRIREWAKSIFMITAISRNSKFDALTMLFLNHKMILEIIRSSGFRPSNTQMLKIYTWILGTAFFPI